MKLLQVSNSVNLRMLALIAVTIAFATAARAQTPTPTPTPQTSTTPAPATPPANPADVATMDSTIAALYDVISGPAGKRDWDRFRSLFIPGARLIPTGARPTGEVGSRVLTVEDYVQRAGAAFEKQGFFEREASRRLEKFGNIAHVFSTYESRRAKDDAKPFQRGINSIQLMNDGKRWWVVTIFWQGEDEKNPLPAMYLKSGVAEITLKSTNGAAVQLDSRIPKADPKEYLPIRQVWQNPNVFVDLNGVYVTTHNRPREIIDSVDNLARVLASLPVDAWPHGRVVTFSQSGRIPIFSVKDSSFYDQAYKNLKQARSVLESLGIDIVDTPIN